MKKNILHLTFIGFFIFVGWSIAFANIQLSPVSVQTSSEVIEPENEKAVSSFKRDTKISYLPYTNNELNYSFKYPQDWLLKTYESNGYTAVGLYDPVAQNQDSRIPDLIQGAKIQISANDFVPRVSIVDHIKSRNPGFLNHEVIEKISEKTIQSGIKIVIDEHTNDNGRNRGTRASFVGGDGKFYTVSLGIPNVEKLSQKEIEDYSSIFEGVLNSIKFNSYEN